MRARVKQAGGTDYDRGYGIGLDAMGNSYVAGFFAGTAAFEGITLASSGGFDSVVARIDGPRLSIARVGTQVVIAWPTNAAGLGLQLTTNLLPPINWSN